MFYTYFFSFFCSYLTGDVLKTFRSRCTILQNNLCCNFMFLGSYFSHRALLLQHNMHQLVIPVLSVTHLSPLAPVCVTECMQCSLVWHCRPFGYPAQRCVQVQESGVYGACGYKCLNSYIYVLVGETVVVVILSTD